MRRRTVLVGAVIAICGAALLSFGLSLVRLPGTLAAEERQLTRLQVASTPPGRSPAERAARALTATPDRTPLWQAAEMYRTTGHDRPFGFANEGFESIAFPPATVGALEQQMAQVLARVTDPKERAQAATWFAVLELLFAGGGRSGNSPVLGSHATNGFREAVLLDPDNEPAKFDLELILRTHGKDAKGKAGKSKAKQRPDGTGAGPAQFAGSGY